MKKNVPFVLAGSIRDDGPLPEVITDALAAQDAMRRLIPGVGFCLMVATTLHSDRGREPVAGLGEGGMRGHQPGNGDQAHGPRQHPDRRHRLRRRAVSSGRW